MRSFAGDHVYGYDSVGRVTSADNPGSLADEVFSYDDLGNRTSGGEQYDGAGRLTARNGFTYLSDREGRVTNRIASNGDTTEFGWSDDGRLESITLPDGTVQQVKYDPLGRRIATTDGSGGTLRQTYGLDSNAVARRDGAGAETRFTFGLGHDQPLAMTTGSASVFFQQDALSSVTSLTDGSGDVVGRYGYDTYGQITSHTGADSPYTYTGRQYNPQAGIYDYRARWYEPATGRFLSGDPVPAENLYAYADNNPVLLRDPTGEETLIDVNEAEEESGKIEMHHSIPKEIQKFLRNAQNRAARDKRVVGRRGCPNRLPVERTYHRLMHSGKGGGFYNHVFDFKVKQRGGYEKVSVEDLLDIRDELMDIFDLDHPGCL